MEEKIKQLLASVIHPETGKDIVSSGFIEHLATAEGKVTVVLRFTKTRDPFAVKIKNQVEHLLQEAFPGAEILVVIKEGGAAPRPEIRNVFRISSALFGRRIRRTAEAQTQERFLPPQGVSRCSPAPILSR